jgi:two-component system, cell cycle sensor histidine kinase and response regulator CckA
MNAEPIPEAKHLLTVSRVTQQFEAPKTILVVEDEAFVREITCDVLENAGFHVLKAGNAPEARTVFRDHREAVQLLLTDVILPGGNGRDLAREFKTMNPALKVICVSGYPENAITPKGLKDGCFYLQKPFSAESLLRKIWYVSALDFEGSSFRPVCGTE